MTMLTGKVTDSASVIADLALAINGGDFQPMAARDGVLDGTSEEVQHKLTKLPPGSHTVLVRATDAADNVATSQLVIQVK
jgi:hypothetical protein